MRIGCDVDLCVVDTGSEWVKWLETVCGKSLSKESVYDYDLTRYFRKELDEMGLDGFQFWRQHDLYDNLQPIKESVENLKELSEAGHEIVFVSSVKGFHLKSKYYFLDKYFPFKSAYISTKEKGYVDVDIMVDDRLENLIQFNYNVRKFLFNTPFRQNLEKPSHVEVVNSWEQVKDEILNE